MAFQLTIRPDAESDLQEAFTYYQECREGLGSDFILCVEHALDRIQSNPFQFPTVYRHIQRALIHRFPFGVFYQVKNKSVIVLAVMHCSRSPERWRTGM